MPWARASALDRHIECPAASHLPRFDEGKWEPGYLIPANHLLVAPTKTPAGHPLVMEDKDPSTANWGSAMHSAKAGAPDAQDPWVSLMAPHRDILWPTQLGEHEVSVSWDCRTKSFELFRHPNEDARTAWKMSRNRDCVVGTADWWGRLPSGEPWIDDLKTGWQEPDVSTYSMMFYMMVRMKQEDALPWQTGRNSICWWARPEKKKDDEGNETMDYGEPTRDGLWRQVTRIQLDAFEEELHWAWVRAVGTNPQPRPGAHCYWCPSSSVCEKANV